MTARIVRVLVGDPLPLFRDGLARLVRQDRELSLVAEAADGQAVLRDIDALRPDVAVLGVPFADIATERIAGAVMRDELPTRIVLVFGQFDPDDSYGAFAHGAAACLTRLADAGTLRQTVHDVAHGGTIVAPELQPSLARAIRRRREPNPRWTLSRRERQVLGEVAAGRCTVEIARGLHISESTVKTHISNASEKLDAPTRAAAVATAMRAGLLD